MKQSSTLYICSYCEAQSPKWTGRCLECGKWGTLNQSSSDSSGSGHALNTKSAAEIVPLSDVSLDQQQRLKIGISEFDTVLGGGIVRGSLILLGGDPGIGKSTIALQILQQISQSSDNAEPLYVSGEESGQQIKLRADRLSVDSTKITYLSQTNVETIVATITKHSPPLVIVDSIQTIYSNDVPSEPGSVTQVRACTVKLLQAAKANNIPIILIGHVTKDGQVAGPKTLEHLVDTVLYLEGDRFHTFRLLRTVKNRFGATNEVGVFEMTSNGLNPVANPSALFISASQNLPGSIVTCILEGNRPFLIEIQALVTKTTYASPQRRASGYDVNRLQLLLAVLNQRSSYNFSAMDVHINVVGGLKIQDPATDLAVCAALISALENKTFDQHTIVLGEVGLAGEIRPVRQLTERLKEAKKLGYSKTYIPDQKTKALIEIKTVKKIDDLNF